MLETIQTGISGRVKVNYHSSSTKSPYPPVIPSVHVWFKSQHAAGRQWRKLHSQIQELKLETVTTSEETLVRCIGKVSYTSAEALRTTVRGLIPGTKRLVLDLSEMTYLDSFGLGVLVSVHSSAKRQHCQLKVINMSQQSQQLLRITNLYLLE